MSSSLKRKVIRVLTPQFLSSLYYLVKYRAVISRKAEVDLSSNLSFGKKCVVASFTKIKALGGPVVIGERSGFATGCFVAAEESGVSIGKNFICGPNVNIIGSNYDLSQKGVHLEDLDVRSVGIRIGENVWVGAGSTILDGAVIGDNTIIVANSLVNRRYPDNVILQGSPAKIIMKR